MSEDDRSTVGDSPVVIPTTFPWADLVAYQHLIKDLRFRNRFIPGSDSQALVRGLVRYARERKVALLAKGDFLFRARSNPFRWGQSPHGPLKASEMGAPPPELAIAGRLNPEGIAYLYLATNEPTAVAEVRPWRGAVLTIARAVITREVQLVDLTPALGTDADDAETVWDLIASAFSLPHHPQDSLSYVHTQYLAGALKAENFEGIKYRSALGPGGFNVALFDPDAAAIEERTYSVRIDDVQYTYHT